MVRTRKRREATCTPISRHGCRICSERRALRRRSEAERAEGRTERPVVRFQREPRSEGVRGPKIVERLTARRGMPRSWSPLSRGTLHTRSAHSSSSRVRSRLRLSSRWVEVELLRERQHWRMRTLSRDCRRLGVGLGAGFGFGEFALEGLNLGFQGVDFAAADRFPAFFLGREIAHDEGRVSAGSPPCKRRSALVLFVVLTVLGVLQSRCRLRIAAERHHL